jgi:hypothetical protein
VARPCLQPHLGQDRGLTSRVSSSLMRTARPISERFGERESRAAIGGENTVETEPRDCYLIARLCARGGGFGLSD